MLPLGESLRLLNHVCGSIRNAHPLTPIFLMTHKISELKH